MKVNQIEGYTQLILLLMATVVIQSGCRGFSCCCLQNIGTQQFLEIASLNVAIFPLSFRQAIKFHSEKESGSGDQSNDNFYLWWVGRGSEGENTL